MIRAGQRLPAWLKAKMPGSEQYFNVKKTVEEHRLHTICKSGLCPNIGECWANGTATFMILGEICTRHCRFCGVTHGIPAPPDDGEPQRVSMAIARMKLRHVVVTSVTRDDLDSGGAIQWTQTIRCIRQYTPNITLETLIPDFSGNTSSIQMIVDQRPDVISHNLETTERLTPLIRSKAQYRLSLKVIEMVARSGITAKSGIMVGLGETSNEVIRTIDDLRNTGCMIITIGQYLQPSAENINVQQFVSPQQFEEYKQYALSVGFRYAECSPLVRSSYHANKHAQSFSPF